jgi:hypothetical protein
MIEAGHKDEFSCYLMRAKKENKGGTLCPPGPAVSP